MARSVEEVIIRLLGESKSAESALDRTAKRLRNFGAMLTGVSDAALLTFAKLGESGAEIEALERQMLDAPLVGEAPEKAQDAPPAVADSLDPAWVSDDGAPQAGPELAPEFPASEGEVPRGGTDVIRRRKPLKGLGPYKGWLIAGGALAGFALLLMQVGEQSGKPLENTFSIH